ncbi:MAG: Crp/Fnr family transcriptional regulator [Gammaproteobacteria bacterium]
MSHPLRSRADRAQFLPPIARCLLFSELAPAQRERILDNTRVIELNEGEILFEQGQPAREFFLLEGGQVKLARYSSEGNEKIIDLILPGGTFAEALMFAKQPAYPVTAVAITASRVLGFSSQVYIGILRDSTEACFAVMAQMSRRLHQHIGEIDRLTLHSATFRVVCYLLDHLPSTHVAVPEVRLDTPKHVIAARLSITPETLSRSFSKLTRDGLITVQDNAITLTDVDRLRRFAKGEAH